MKVDAQILADYGQVMHPELSEIQNPKINKLRELIKYRRQLTDNLVLTKQWIEKKPTPQIISFIVITILYFFVTNLFDNATTVYITTIFNFIRRKTEVG